MWLCETKTQRNIMLHEYRQIHNREDISVDIEKDLMFDTSNYELENHYLKQ